MIGSTLTKYKDNASKQLICDLIVSLLTLQHDLAIENLMALLKVLACKELPNAPIDKASQAAITVLGWSTLINKHGDFESNVLKTELPRLIEYQSLLYHTILIGSTPRVLENVDRMVFEMLEDSGYFNEYLSLMLKKEANNSHSVVWLMLIFKSQHFSSATLLNEYRNQLLDYFVKGIVTSKTKPHSNSIPASRILLSTLTKNEFESKLLPPLLRAMLRNPEIILNSVGLIVHEIQLDFSPYALQLGKILLQNLYSKDEMARIESVNCLKRLALKCSKANVIVELLQNIFAILNGSEGKITIAEYRINLVQVSYTLFNMYK